MSSLHALRTRRVVNTYGRKRHNRSSAGRGVSLTTSASLLAIFGDSDSDQDCSHTAEHTFNTNDSAVDGNQGATASTQNAEKVFVGDEQPAPSELHAQQTATSCQENAVTNSDDNATLTAAVSVKAKRKRTRLSKAQAAISQNPEPTVVAAEDASAAKQATLNTDETKTQLCEDRVDDKLGVPKATALQPSKCSVTQVDTLACEASKMVVDAGSVLESKSLDTAFSNTPRSPIERHPISDTRTIVGDETGPTSMLDTAVAQETDALDRHVRHQDHAMDLDSLQALMPLPEPDSITADTNAAMLDTSSQQSEKSTRACIKPDIYLEPILAKTEQKCQAVQAPSQPLADRSACIKPDTAPGVRRRAQRTYGKRTAVPSHEDAATKGESAALLSHNFAAQAPVAPKHHVHRVAHTYGRQRSFQEQSIDEMLAELTSGNRWLDVDNESESAEKKDIRSSHELRELGMLRRYADELDDLMDGVRVGQPLSVRRSSALELCRKLRDPQFAGLFRSSDLLEPYYMALATEEDAVLCPCFLFALCLLATDGRNGKWLVARGVVVRLAAILAATVGNASVPNAHQLPASISGLVAPVGTNSLGASAQRQLEQLAGWISDTDQLVLPGQPCIRRLALSILASLSKLRSRGEAVIRDVVRNTTALTNVLDIFIAALHDLDSSKTAANCEADAQLCLRILESVTLCCLDNQRAVVEHKDTPQQLSNALLRAYEQMLQQKSAVHADLAQDVQELPLALLRLCINLSNECPRACAVLADADLATVTIQCIHRIWCEYDSGAVNGPLADALLLMIGLLVNLVECNIGNRERIRYITTTASIDPSAGEPVGVAALPTLLPVSRACSQLCMMQQPGH
ncbi:hypothetical protein THASP1DRAFT_32468 [Thamnocephalis sphaerospora]|uniref:Wings apart-like protein C-terminal domain-containing protein n=1 Tax=Thamnocephalis sphaerospora TaxID=78915 RepID=A0A4P9XIY7_9FUNG|nr:hypothetical protein THASP1DRAFT_32468 [Thamnocephalis sphaerospora]|eukprot:RKP05694.1 hypothetical protein THASP1DRAFT_32468 [Thamnocephalis sphaerospora]